jgi:hypothetical protein
MYQSFCQIIQKVLGKYIRPYVFYILLGDRKKSRNALIKKRQTFINNLQINNKNVEINSQNEQNKNNIWLCLWCGEINKNINDKYCTNCKKEKDKKTIKVICHICKQEKLNGYKCKSCNIQVKYDCPKCKKALPIRIQKCVYCEKNIK